MKYREYLERHLSNDTNDEIAFPKRYHLVGDVAIIDTSIREARLLEKIGEVTLSYDSRIKSVAVKLGPTKGMERVPSLAIIAGNPDTNTIHIENGVKFRLDPLQLTFSRGNVRERISMPSRVGDDEHVVDMFACVGQFGLHVACKTQATVSAIEINPLAFNFLRENIKLNNVQERMTAILGDCRHVSLERPANRVIMGYLHNTIEYLPAALNFLANSGGIIHMHSNLCHKELQNLCNTINTVCNKFGYTADIEYRKVKSYSPRVFHFVFDINLVSKQ